MSIDYNTYKQILFTKKDNGCCPVCCSVIANTEQRINILEYSADFQKYRERECLVNVCPKCHNVFITKENSSCLKIHNGYRICAFLNEQNNKREVREKSFSFPQEYIDALQKQESEQYDLNVHNYEKKYERILSKDIAKEYDAPKSTVAIVLYEMTKFPETGIRKACIVRNKSDEKTVGKNIYHKNHEYSKIILDALHNCKNEFSYQGLTRKLHRYYLEGNYRSDFYRTKETLRKFSNANYKNLFKINVYKRKGYICCSEYSTETVNAYIVGSRTMKPAPITVYYCCVCKAYYIDYNQYRDFCLKNGLPPFAITYVEDKKSSSYYDYLNDKSKLRLLGYYVSGNLKNDSIFRKRLLEEIINTGLMSKAEIISHIEGLIESRNKSCPGAVERWKSDLEYVYQINRNEERTIIGEFVPGSKLFSEK